MLHPKAYDAEDALQIIADLRDLEGPLLPILNAFQARYGCIGEAAIRLISAELNLSRAEVYGVVSFYHDYRSVPPGRHVLKVCRAEACQAAGGTAVAASLERALGVRMGETSADGQVTLEAVYCLGLCATAPAAMLDGRLVGRLTEAKIGPICDEVRL